MMRHRGTVVAAVVCALTVAYADAALQKPTVRRPITLERRTAAASLDDLWKASDVVVEAVIERDEVADYTAGGVEQIHTMYQAIVDTAFKSSTPGPGAGSRIPVRRMGGIRERADRIEVHEPPDFPLFSRGQRFVMFLRQHEWSGDVPYRGRFYFGTTYDGPDSFYEIREGRVSTTARTRTALDLAASSAENLRALLRQPGRR